jgi:hypothetical protein
MKCGGGKVTIIDLYFYEIYSFLNSEEIKNNINTKKKDQSK